MRSQLEEAEACAGKEFFFYGICLLEGFTFHLGRQGKHRKSV